MDKNLLIHWWEGYVKNTTHSLYLFFTIILFFSLTDLLAQEIHNGSTPCTAYKWVSNSTQQDCRGLIECKSAAQTSSNTITSEDDGMNDFTLDGGDCGYVPGDQSNVVWLQFDFPPGGGTFQMQINNTSVNSPEIRWELYYSTVSTDPTENSGCSDYNDLGGILQGDCNSLEYAGYCGDKNQWDLIKAPELSYFEYTNYYVAVYTTDGSDFDFNFKARRACGDDGCYLGATRLDDRVCAEDGNSYEITIRVGGVNGTYYIVDPDATSIDPPSFTFTNIVDGGPVGGYATLTYPESVEEYCIIVTEGNDGCIDETLYTDCNPFTYVEDGNDITYHTCNSDDCPCSKMMCGPAPSCCKLEVNCLDPDGGTYACGDDVPAPDNSLIGVVDEPGPCGSVSISSSDQSSGDICSASGMTITRTYTITDDRGTPGDESDDESTTCTQTFTVKDDVAPHFTSVPADKEVECDAIPNVGTAMADDNCDDDVTIQYLGQSQPMDVDPDCPGNYKVIRTWKATDDCGNTKQASQTITLTDTTAPEGDCSELDDLNNNVCFADRPAAPTKAEVAAKYTDNCSNVNVEPGTPEVVSDQDCGWEIEYPFTITDDCGNETSCTIIHSGGDTSTPEGDCSSLDQSDIDACFSDRPSPPTADEVAALFSTACGGGSATATALTPTIISSNDCGWEIEYPYSISGGCDNTSTTCTVTHSGSDQTDPEIVLDSDNPMMIGIVEGGTLQVECEDFALLGLGVGDVSVTDNCDDNPEVGFYETFIPGPYDCPTVARFICYWLAYDECGNKDSLGIYVEKIDTKGPVSNDGNADADLSCDDEEGLAEALAFEPTFTDGCDENEEVNMSLIKNETTYPDGEDCANYTITREWQAYDDCMNLSKKFTQVITVTDDEAPTLVFVRPDLMDYEDGDTLTIECDEFGGLNLQASDVEGSDNCADDIEVIFVDVWLEHGECPTVDLYNCYWEASDGCNTATLGIIINVVDTTPPEFVDPPADLCGDDALTGAEFADYVPPTLTATDNCSDPTVSGPTVSNNDNCDDWEVYFDWVAKDSPCENETPFRQIVCISDPVPVCDITTRTDLVCGTDDNYMYAHVTGGVPPYTYAWRVSEGNWQIVGDNKTDEIRIIPVSGGAIVELEVTGANGCSSTCEIFKACVPIDNEYCTFTQGFWGNPGGWQFGETTIDIIKRLLQVDIDGDGYGDPLTVGVPGNSLSFPLVAADCLNEFLPGDGKSEPLPGDGDLIVGTFCEGTGSIEIKNGRFKNTLLTQTIALSLNIRYDPTLYYLELQYVCGDIHANIYNELGADATVGDLLDLANRALGGEYDGNLGQVTAAVGLVNDTFSECREACGGGAKNIFEEDLSLKMYPNPVGGKLLNIEYVSVVYAPATIHIYTLYGKEMASYESEAKEGLSTATIDVGMLPTGAYILEVRVEHTRQRMKFVKLN